MGTQISVADYRIDTLLARLYDLAAQFDFEPDVPIETGMLISNLPLLLDQAASAMRKAVSVYKDEYGDGHITETIKIHSCCFPPSEFYEYEDLYGAVVNDLSWILRDMYDSFNDPDALSEMVPPEYKEAVKEYFEKLTYTDSYGTVDYFKLRLALPSAPEPVETFYDCCFELEPEQMKDFIISLLELMIGALEKLKAGGDVYEVCDELYDECCCIEDKYGDLIGTMALITNLALQIDALMHKIAPAVLMKMRTADEVADIILSHTFRFLEELAQCLLEWQNDATWFVNQCNLCYRTAAELCELIENQFSSLADWAEDIENWREFVQENFPEYYDEIYGEDKEVAYASAS